MYDDVTAIYDLSGGPRVIPSYKHILPRKDQAPKLIPQIIHQTYKSSQVPNNVRPMMHSWRRVNPNWEIRFYDDEACRDFVAKEFPEYVQAYRLVQRIKQHACEVQLLLADVLWIHATPLLPWHEADCMTVLCVLATSASLTSVPKRLSVTGGRGSQSCHEAHSN